MFGVLNTSKNCYFPTTVWNLYPPQFGKTYWFTKPALLQFSIDAAFVVQLKFLQSNIDRASPRTSRGKELRALSTRRAGGSTNPKRHPKIGSRGGARFWCTAVAVELSNLSVSGTKAFNFFSLGLSVTFELFLHALRHLETVSFLLRTRVVKTIREHPSYYCHSLVMDRSVWYVRRKFSLHHIFIGISNPRYVPRYDALETHNLTVRNLQLSRAGRVNDACVYSFYSGVGYRH